MFVLVTFDVVCLKSIFSHFLESNYRGLNLKLAQRLTDGDTESNPCPVESDCNFTPRYSKKIKVFKRAPKKFDLSENSNVNVVSYPKVQDVFFNTIQPLNLNNTKPWSVTSPGTVESLEKM